MSDRAQALKEVKRFVHQVKALVEFADNLEELDRLATETAETKTRLERLRTEEVELRARVDAAGKQASETVQAAKAKAAELVADAERRAGEITARAEATAAKLAADTTELTRVGASLQAMKAEVENLRSRFN
jgi:cell division septum initiation protein DivIVA